MTKVEFTALLDRYVQGTCTPEEEDLFNRFVERMAATPPGWSLEEADRLKLEIWLGIRQRIPATAGRAPVFRIPNWLRVAALIVVVTTLIFYFIARQQEPALITVATKAGERDTVLLADGSRVYLNEASAVAFPRRFTGDKRPVSLQGEAFFEVAKDKDRPFSVEAGGFRTVALGTSFNIRALSDSSDVKVSLMTGKVAISALSGQDAKADRVHTLTPGNQLRYKLAEKRVTIEEFNPSIALAWRMNKLAFDNEPLDVVLNKLEKLYNIGIVFDKQVAHRCRVNGVFEADESLQTILSVLTFSNNLSFSQQQHQYIITGAGCE